MEYFNLFIEIKIDIVISPNLRKDKSCKKVAAIKIGIRLNIATPISGHKNCDRIPLIISVNFLE